MYIHSNNAGFKNNYRLQIECSSNADNIYCILSKCDYQQERIESEADFVSYPSALNVEISFENFTNYNQALNALLDTLEVKLYKNDLIWFQGYIENSEDVTFDNENRVISISVMNILLKLKELNKNTLPSEYFGVFNTWKFYDIIKTILDKIYIRQITYIGLDNLKASYGVQKIGWYDLYYDVRWACLNYEGSTVWDILKLICNLLLIEVNIIGDRAVITNKYLYGNQTPVNLTNHDFSINTEYSYRKKKKDFCIKSYLYNDNNNDPVYKNVPLRGNTTAGENIEIFVGGGTMWGNINSDYRFCFIYADSNMGFVACPYGLTYASNFPLYTQTSATSTNLMLAHARQVNRNLLTIKTKITGELLIYDFYKIGNNYFKIIDYSYSIIDNVTEVTFLQTIP